MDVEDSLSRKDNKRRKRVSRRDESSSEHTGSSSSYERRKKKSKKRSKSLSHSRRKKEKNKRRRKYSSSSESTSSADSSDDDAERRNKIVVNERLLAKLKARGETLEERRERRAQKRAAHIAAAFGYTAEENPFNDPNLHEAFTWKKKKEKVGEDVKASKIDETLSEIDKVRQRRKDREEQLIEMERIRAEESRMRELENAEEWERKEEEFHLQQQRQRSAIRLVEGREKPIDVLAKNMLLFGLSEEEKRNRASVKYKEKFNAMEAIESLEAELEEPHILLHNLKLEELEELLVDIEAFQTLEATAATPERYGDTSMDQNPVLRYWDALSIVAKDEIKFLKGGGSKGSHASMVEEVQKIFVGQSLVDLSKMQQEITDRIRNQVADAEFDLAYWKVVLEQLGVYMAKVELSDMHNKMLARQLEQLEIRRQKIAEGTFHVEDEKDEKLRDQTFARLESKPSGEVEEELGDADEMKLAVKTYSWQDKYRPRKPRYFNRVRTGYDWNKYNQVHFDKDNPPPKVVQGYKFNVFYPDLIDPSKTPTFFLERADSDEFCIIRFHAGPPYEDIAFKIINREWNRSRKRGYKCSFERGVLSLYFNFKTHWYRR